MAIAAAAMTAVASQPKNFSTGGATNSSMMLGFETTIINPTRIGTAATPLITALQNSAFIGLIGDQSIATPSSMPSAMTA